MRKTKNKMLKNSKKEKNSGICFDNEKYLKIEKEKILERKKLFPRKIIYRSRWKAFRR